MTVRHFWRTPPWFSSPNILSPMARWHPAYPCPRRRQTSPDIFLAVVRTCRTLRTCTWFSSSRNVWSCLLLLIRCSRCLWWKIADSRIGCPHRRWTFRSRCGRCLMGIVVIDSHLCFYAWGVWIFFWVVTWSRCSFRTIRSFLGRCFWVCWKSCSSTLLTWILHTFLAGYSWLSNN